MQGLTFIQRLLNNCRANNYDDEQLENTLSTGVSQEFESLAEPLLAVEASHSIVTTLLEGLREKDQQYAISIRDLMEQHRQIRVSIEAFTYAEERLRKDSSIPQSTEIV